MLAVLDEMAISASKIRFWTNAIKREYVTFYDEANLNLFNRVIKEN